jgi:threonine synthase
MANSQAGTLLATAHPFKFKNVIEKAVRVYPEEWQLDDQAGMIQRIEMEADFDLLRKKILNTTL